MKQYAAMMMPMEMRMCSMCMRCCVRFDGLSA